MDLWDGGMRKGMDEASGPYFYGCPIEWLDEVPEAGAQLRTRASARRSAGGRTVAREQRRSSTRISRVNGEEKIDRGSDCSTCRLLALRLLTANRHDRHRSGCGALHGVVYTENQLWHVRRRSTCKDASPSNVRTLGAEMIDLVRDSEGIAGRMRQSLLSILAFVPMVES